MSYFDSPGNTGGTPGDPDGDSGNGGVTPYSSQALEDMLIADAVAAGTDMYHVDEASLTNVALVEAQPGAGDYAYVDRSFGGAIVYEADGSTSNIDFDGNENTFLLRCLV